MQTFDLLGNDPAIDFANTLTGRSDPEPREKLGSYADLLSFTRQAGVVEPDQATRLLAEAERNREQAAAVLRDARELREAIFRVYAALAEGGQVADADLAVLNASFTRAGAAKRVAPVASGFAWRWAEADRRLDAPLWPLAEAAARLLTSPERERVRECAADDCRWLFLDTSKNHSRRWCDMKECGNRAKVKAFYRRRREPVS